MDTSNAPWVVLKFGGTSVSTPERWQCIFNQICYHLNAPDGDKRRVWVTISALSQVTNKLQQALAAARDATDDHGKIAKAIALQHFELAFATGLLSTSELTQEEWRERWLSSVFGDTSFAMDGHINDALPETLHPLLKELKNLVRVLEGIKLTEETSPRIHARVLAFGELLSTHLGVCILNHLGLSRVQRVDARKLLIATASRTQSEDDRFLQAQVLPTQSLKTEALSLADNCPVVLTQGFICSTSDHSTAVLGRGGSDTSGALFAALLEAKSFEIWTDVHGMFSTDPRAEKHARLITDLDYREAQELAAMGAKVLHPRCILPAQWANVPVEIRNTNDPDGPRTVIRAGSTEDAPTTSKILAVMKRQSITTLSITAFDMFGTSGFLARVFAPFQQFGISVDLIATSQFSVTVTLDHIPGGTDGDSFQRLLEVLQEQASVEVFYNCSVVSIVGRRLRCGLGQLGGALGVLEGYDVLLVSESAEDLNLSFVLQQSDSNNVVAHMHRFFFNEEDVAGQNGSIFGPTWEELKI